MEGAARRGKPTLKRPIETVRRERDGITILDQTELPFRTVTRHLTTVESAAVAIRSMRVRGAPLIGATAAFGVALAMSSQPTSDALDAAVELLGQTRPTAVNLHWALHRMRERLRGLPDADRPDAAWAEAEAIAAEDAAACEAIGEHGLVILAALAGQRGGPVRVLTHCNAGWLATCGIGTALAPVFTAHAHGVPVDVFVSETRPRDQGLLTAWELREAGVPHTLVADNAAGYLLATGRVDTVITGADRIAANGDTANKVGTWLKALAAQAVGVPFYVAAPSSTLDFSCPDGARVPIEDRGADEVCLVRGLDANGEVVDVRLAPAQTRVANPAFDITPASFVTGFITERGLVAPTALADSFPERIRSTP
ncbi:MAG: S-methyl-5-thioribose-1-phosphate isomerase [Propionicimonas sp.]